MDRGAAADPEAVTSQVQLVLSRDLAREVIDRLKLGDRPEFDPAINGISPVKAVLGMLGLIKNPRRMTPQERVLDAYYDRLQVFRRREVARHRHRFFVGRSRARRRGR